MKHAGKIVASWITAIILLVGGLYAVQGHTNYYQAAKGSSCGWVKASEPTDGTPVWVNLGAATSVYANGTRDGKNVGAVIWFGPNPTAVKEDAADIMAKCGG